MKTGKDTCGRMRPKTRFRMARLPYLSLYCYHGRIGMEVKHDA